MKHCAEAEHLHRVYTQAWLNDPRRSGRPLLDYQAHLDACPECRGEVSDLWRGLFAPVGGAR